MMKFMFKSFLLAALLFIAVLTGMQQANVGMHKLKGYDDPGLNNAFSMEEREDGEVETVVLGNNISSHDLEKKKEELEKIKAYNFFSNMGKKLAEAISSATQKMIGLIEEKLQ